MIIDDEPVVRAGIKKLISWENYNFELCAEGIDGKDGLRKVLDFSPDLVLVDVKMPGMSGIELIREAKKEGFEGKFIILTGYSDFDFAKSAISLGVRAYLLKPIDEIELQENLQEVLEELDAKKNLDDYYTLSELKARQEVLYRLLLHSEDKETLRREIKLYGMDFNYHSFCTAILSTKTTYYENDTNKAKECEELILKDMAHVDKLTVDDNLVLICKGHSYQDMLTTLIKNNERVKRYFGEGYFIAIGHNVANWEDLSFSYECAKLLSKYEFLYKDSEAVSIEMLSRIGIKAIGNFTDRLCSLIEIGDAEALHLAINELKNNYKTELMKESEIKVLVIHNMVLLHCILERKYESKKEQFPKFEQFIWGIKHVESLEALMVMVTDYCIGATQCIGASTTDVVVKRMTAYIEKNYDQDLKLESIAKIFNYNSAYLGKVFKKEVGESFNNVLDTIRIENAKRLLRESDLRVYQVSEQVGYSNIDYFYSKFKKYVGISPKEYKTSDLN
jgi:two-component system response regulator YesN